MSAGIELDDVHRTFGTRRVLNGVTGNIEAGRAVGLLGRNGEGKSTLIKILLDILAADWGKVRVGGRTPDGTGLIRQHVGYVPERPAFHDFMTGQDVLDFRARLFKRWDPARAAKLAKRLELDLKIPVSGGSKGTVGKLAWVCAAAHDPEVYLLDEPTSGLDALVRDDVLGHFIEELSGSGKTILVTNHRMEELAGVLDEVWVLSKGRIRSKYTTEALRAEGRHITARRKEGPGAAGIEGAVRVGGEGALEEWAAFTREAVEALEGHEAFESVDAKPLGLKDSFRWLLKD